MENLRRDLERLGAVRAAVEPAAVQVMKPRTAERPFTRAGWVFELKYDGFRMLAAGGAGEARLFYKSRHDSTRIFPELAGAVSELPFSSLILDGEAVILDESGRPSFQRLQRRGLKTRAIDAGRLAAASPATLFVFDLLAAEGFDLRPLPLSTRKELLRRVVPGQGSFIRLSEEIPERGEDLFAAVEQMGLEGVVAKRADSAYRGGYQTDWLKMRVDRSSDFAVVGFEPIHGSRLGLRNLHLAVRADGGWVYAGTVGSGFSQQDLKNIRARLEPARRPSPPLDAPASRGTVWVEPELAVEVRYKEWTAGGHLRHPVFLRVRDDKTVEECFRPGEEGEEEDTESARTAAVVGAQHAAPPQARAAASSPPGRPHRAAPTKKSAAQPSFTNLQKVYWPGEGITKGDLVEYYRTVAPWMLPYLKDRPLVLDRYPDGITGKSFYQKNVPPTVTGRVRTFTIESGGSGRPIEYILCDDAEGLLSLVNLGVIPFHLWSSRVESLSRPDWCILDLDPKTAPFAHVVEIALAIRDLCEEIEWPGFIKTSGGSGLHVLLPTGGLLEHDPVRQIAELLAQVIVKRLPKIATTARTLAARGGRVYVDALQNGRGKLLAAPYAVRPRPGAPVSTPLDWKEVNSRLDVSSFNLKTLPQRLKRRKDDPLLAVLETRPDLERALDLLAQRV